MSDEFALNFKDRALAEFESLQNENRLIRKSLNLKLDALQTKKRSLLDLRLSNSITDDEFLALKTEHSEKEIDIKTQLLRLDDAENIHLDKISYTIEFMKNVGILWNESLSDEAKIDFIRIVVLELVFDKQKSLHVAFTGVFEEIRNWNVCNGGPGGTRTLDLKIKSLPL